MMANQRDFSIITFCFAVVTLLSCCSPAASFFLPKVTRTDDAIIIDLESSGYSAPIQRKNVYGDIANSKFVPLPFFNPYAMMYQQPQQMMYNGWSYFYGHPGLSTGAGVPSVPSSRQFEDEDEELFDEEPAVKQLQISGPTITTTTKPTSTPANPTSTPANPSSTPSNPSSTPANPSSTTSNPSSTPAPSTVIQCGGGPIKFPGHHHHRASISERIAPSVGEVPVLGSSPAAAVAPAKKNAWPFMVTLKNSAGILFCAGTLISDTRVLLAAQCMEKLSLVDMSGVTVLIGVTGPTDVQMTRRISKVTLHSKYNAVNYANDIAIIVLDSPVVLSKTVAPACLPPASADPDQYADQKAIILGWGQGELKKPSPSLLQAKVDLVPNSECRVDADFGKYVSDASICVSSTEAFTCAGDIGGPVVILPSPGTWTVVGVNSYTKSDCTATGLKTRVSAFRAWIDMYMN